MDMVHQVDFKSSSTLVERVAATAGPQAVRLLTGERDDPSRHAQLRMSSR